MSITQAHIEAIVGPIEYIGQFVPWSLSRSAGEKYRNLNWRLTLSIKGKPFSCDYSAGTAHIPTKDREAEKKPYRMTAGVWNAVQIKTWENQYCETGKPGLPNLADVVYSLLMDGANCIDQSFEEWCSNYGYDTDSRTVERIYNACKDTGAWLCKAVGRSGINKLQELFQDY
ncbi:hypothetical protein UFOVP785_95 [uncultured Caudovirales phage]|uniref:Uncharacterized protein n=1 Tax=uncultured Caudovirales phage TaxID=2100421 RepID=A0A6J5NYD1_9CAUD|nr:hypothetical protein UFOVP785_95 [uncultured Caudovirales phage]